MTENVESLLKEIRQKNTEKRRNKILSAGKPAPLPEAIPIPDKQMNAPARKKNIDLDEIASRVEGRK